MRIPSLLLLVSVSMAASPVLAQVPPQIAKGVVFYDQNANGIADSNEQRLEGIRVSNGVDIVKTDKEGRYELPVTDDTILFVIKPRGWRPPLSSDMLPRFYYIHKPAGSPPSQFPGVAPTGPLPESVDFPLYPQEEPEKFKAIFFGDPQPRNLREVEYGYHDVIENLIGTDASFGVTLGDIAFDNLDTFEPQNRGIAMIGIPWYNVIGNHDLNKNSRTDRDSDETFHRVFGPNYYSFEYGNVHFIALDDVNWRIPEGAQKGDYFANIDADQMQFIRNDLALIPEDQPVVLMMHIPLVSIRNREELYRLIEKRPFCISISGHTHYQEHIFIKKKDGWMGPQPHHHIVNVTVCGSWWGGAPDELGIPHTMMRDGAPNGHSVMTFDGTSYDWEFVPARRNPDYQMHIYAPEVLKADNTSTEVLVNIFGGSEKSLAVMRVNEGEWVQLEKVMREDPYFMDIKELEQKEHRPLGRRLPNAIKSPHLWRGVLPANLSKGTHLISVKTRDMFGKEYSAERLIRVE